jgi:hypothetical protein
MRRRDVSGLVTAVAVLMTAGAVNAQLLPPVPPKSPPTEPYTPPPVAPPSTNPPARPEPEAETPLPSLVTKGPDGKIVRLNVLPEEAAVRAVTFDDATRARIDAGIAEYRADMDRRVTENPALVVQLIHERETIDTVSSVEELQKIIRGIGVLAPGSLLERLQHAGALNPRQRHRVDQVAQEYTHAVTAEVNADAGPADLTKMMVLGGRRAFIEMSAEAVRSLERQLAKIEPNEERILSGLSLGPAQKSQVDMLLVAPRERVPEERRTLIRRTNLRAIFVDVLNDEQRTQLLKAGSPELWVPKADGAPAKSGG